MKFTSCEVYFILHTSQNAVKLNICQIMNILFKLLMNLLILLCNMFITGRQKEKTMLSFLSFRIKIRISTETKKYQILK